MDGLTVKNGRLVNERPIGMTGIQQAANMKRIIKEDRKIKSIADGIERAESMKKFRGLLQIFSFMLVNVKVASATFSISGTSGSTLNFTPTDDNYIICVVIVMIVSIVCRFYDSQFADYQGHVDNVDFIS